MSWLGRDLPLRREVHALEEGLEAGVGAEGVQEKMRVEMEQLTIAFVGRLLEPRDGSVPLLPASSLYELFMG